jgi:hypothetical protein
MLAKSRAVGNIGKLREARTPHGSDGRRSSLRKARVPTGSNDQVTVAATQAVPLSATTYMDCPPEPHIEKWEAVPWYGNTLCRRFARDRCVRAFPL